MKRVCLLVLAFLCSNLAFAANCTQGNLTGAWQFSGQRTWSTEDSIEDIWSGVSCKIRVDAAGRVIGQGSGCFVLQRALTPKRVRANITNGALRVNSACDVTGRFRMCLLGECEFVRLRGAKLGRSKDTITLRASEDANRSWLTLAGVKNIPAYQCSQGDLTGKWSFGGERTWGEIGGAGTTLIYCDMEISPAGAVVGSGSRCKLLGDFTPNGSPPEIANITGGNLSVDSACNVTGRFRLCVQTDGVCEWFVPQQAKLGRGKEILPMYAIGPATSTKPFSTNFVATGLKH